MAVVTTALVAGKVLSSVLGFAGKRKAAKAQKRAAEESRKIAYENAASMRQENAETERRAARSIAQVEGESAARSAAGGSAQNNANTKLVEAALSGENAKQFEWLQLSGETRAKAVEREGDYNKFIGEAKADATKWSAYGDLVEGVGAMASIGAFDLSNPNVKPASQPQWMFNPAQSSPINLLFDPTLK